MSALINVLLGLIVIGLAIGLTITLVKLSNVKNGSNKFTCGTGTKPGPLGLECVPTASGTTGYECGPGTKPGPLDMKCIPNLETICTGKLQPGPDNNCVIKAGECASPDGTQNICTEECCVRTLNMKWENGVCKPKDGFALCPNDKMSSGGTCVDVPTIDPPGSSLNCGYCTVPNDAGTECIMSASSDCTGTGTGTGTDTGTGTGTGTQPQPQTTSEPSKTARDAAIALAVLAAIVGVIFYITKLRKDTKDTLGNAAAGAWGAARGGAGSVVGSVRSGASRAWEAVPSPGSSLVRPFMGSRR